MTGQPTSLRTERRRARTQSIWRREPRRVTAASISVISAAALIVLWAVVTRPGGLIAPLFLPPPGDVAAAFVRLAGEPYLGALSVDMLRPAC